MGYRRGRTTGERRWHAGMDLGHTSGTGASIFNVAPGTVSHVLTDDDRRRAFRGYGNGVIVHQPDSDTWILYAHMDRVDVREGQQVAAGQQLGTMGNSSNGKFAGMGPHLHMEVRRRRPNGAPGFPGPYPQSDTAAARSHIEPMEWFAQKGLRFAGRGSFEMVPNSQMDGTRHIWDSRQGMSGVDPYPTHLVRGMAVPETSLAGSNALHPYRGGMAGLGAPILDEPMNDAYEPVRFDRDVWVGLTPTEWGFVGAGTLLVTGTAVGLIARRSLRKNKRRRRRTSRAARLRGKFGA